MTGIQGKQLTFDICHQVVCQIHAFNLRDFTLKGCLLNVPLVVVFYHNVDEVLALYRRNNAVNRAVRESDVLVTVCLILFAQSLVNGFLELGACTDRIFTCNDVQCLCAALLSSLYNALCNGRSNTRQDNQTNRSRDYFRFFVGNRINDSRCSGINRADIVNRNILARYVHDMYCISTVCVDLINNCLNYITKDYMIACLSQQHTNKSTADITGTKLNRCFHNTIRSPFS